MADAEFDENPGVLPDFDKDHEYEKEKSATEKKEEVASEKKEEEKGEEPIEEINTADHADPAAATEDEGLVELDYSLYDL